MESLKEILINLLSNEKVNIQINMTDDNILHATESTCYKILRDIKNILQNNLLNDFEAIEKIVLPI